MNHTLLRSAAQQRAVLTLALFLCASILAHAATWYVRTTGSDANDGTSTAQAFLTIQKAINSAANGDVIDVGAGTFAPTTTLAVNKEVRITGQGEGTTIIDVGGYNAWGIYITANNVTIEDLTVDGDATTNLQFCVKIGTGGPAGAGKSVAEDFTLEDVTIQNTWRTALDLNGVDGAAITRVTCQNVGNGFGMSISSSHNVTVTNLTTSNCAWGDAGIFPANTAFQWNTALDGPDNIVFAGMLTLGAGSISVQDGALSDSRGTWVGTISNDPADNANVTVPTSFTHYVNATRSGGLVLHNVGTEANIVTLAQGMAVGIAPFTFSNITVRDMANDEWDVPSGLKIQAAIDAATAGDVVNVAAGTFAETIIIAKPLTLKGANYGVAGNAGRGGESIISGASTGGALGAVMVNGNGSSSMPVTIDGFWILKGTTPNIRGILLGNTTSVKGPITISNNIINGGWSTGISLAGGATVGWVDDVTITNNKLVGSGIGSTENATDLVIQNNTFDNAGLGLGGGASMAAAISGNTFTGTTTSRYVGIANGVTLATGETLASIVANNTFDKSVALSAASGQWYTQAIFAQINPAVSVAATGATLTVSAGTFAENITVNKRVTIDGAGSGSDASSNTIISAAASGTSTIVYSAGGSDASNRQVLRGVRVTGASGGTGNNNSGILISGSSNMGYFTFDNIVSTGNTGHGFISNFGSPSNVLSYVYIGNSSFESNGSYGLRTASHSIDSLTIENVTFQDNASLGMSMNPSESNSANLGRITLTDVTFSGNASVAEFYAYRLTGAMALSNVDFIGDGGAGQAYYIQGQYLSETAAPAAGTITLSDVSITGSYTTSGMRIQGYSNCSSISFSDVVLNATISTADRGQLHLNGLASTIDLGNTSFGTGAPLYIRLGGNFGAAGSKSTISVDATNATFDGKKGSEMTLTELFDLEDRIRHGLDNTTDAPGFVRVNASNVYTTANSGSIQRGIDAAMAGDVVNVAAGTFAENLTVNKSLTLQGANAGIDPNTGSRSSETTLDGTFGIQSSNVTIDGFAITGTSYAVQAPGTGQSNITLQYNHMYANTGGRTIEYWGSAQPAQTWTIKNNLIEDVRANDATAITLFNITGVTITDNVVQHTNSTYTGRRGHNLDGCRNIVFERNMVDMGLTNPAADNSDGSFTAARYSLQLSCSNRSMSTVSIAENTFKGAYSGVITLGNGDYYDIAITENMMTDNVLGVRFQAGTNGPTGALSNITVSYNNIISSNRCVYLQNGTSSGTADTYENIVITSNNLQRTTTGVALEVQSGSLLIGGPISSTCNWYGSADAATVGSRISGNLNATPFLVDGTDSSSDPGFQPAAGSCTGTGPVLVYSDVAESTLVDTYFTIQSAIDATTTLDGYVVRVPAGTYREFVTINKQLDLRGPNWNTPGNSTSRWAEAIIRFPAGETATSMSLVDIGIWNSTSNPANGSKIRGFTIDGSDYTVGYNTSGVYAVQSDLIIENNIIRNFNQQSIVVTSWRYIGGNWSNTYWTNGADISDNLIVNDGVLLPSLNNASYGFGIYMQGSYGTVERNAVQGYFRTGIQIQPYNHPNTSNLVGLVSSNSFAGYARGMYFNYSENANGDWLFEHNDVTGIAVPTGLSNTFSAVHVNTFLAGNCSIENNSIALGDASGTTNLLFLEQNTTNGTFTATCNWWGSDDAATVASNISGNVSFLPFLSSVAPSDYTNPGFTPSGDCDGLGPVTSDDPVASYMTIQSAINGANTGATITASAGTYTENVNLNKEVTLTGTGATIAGTTTISDEDAVLTNMTLNGSPALTFSSGIGSYTLGASNTFDAACTTYVQLTNASTNVTLPGTTVLGGTTLSTLTPNAAENYAIEDKINHGVDDSYAGIVRWNGNRLYVTANTGTLQHVIDVASTSDAIYIDNITVNENPILYKDIVLNSRSSAARRLGTSNYFVFGTTSLGTSNFSGFTTGELDKIGVNTNGSVSEAITAVNASGTVLLTDAVQSGGTADTEFSTTITIDDKALTVMGVGTTGTDECAVAPKMSINAGNSSLISLDGTQDVVLENLDLIIGSTGTFAEIANGATGDITGKDLRFYVDNGTTTTRLMGIQSKTFPTILADNKDVPEYILDGNDVGYGPGEFIFANSAPIDRSKLIAAWKGNDASGTSIATLYDYSGSGYDLTQTTGSRRPQKSTAVFGESVYIPNSGTRLLTRNSNADISTGTAKTIFVVFRTPSGGSGNRIIYKHGDDAAGFSLGLLGNGNVEMNLFSGGELATFTQAIATNTNVIAQAYFDGSSTTNRVGMSYDYGTTHVNDVFTSGDFNTASLAAPPYNATSQVTLGGLEGETYFNGGSRNSRRPGFIAKNTYIAEVIILNTADDGVRDDVYCYLNQKYGAGDSENGLPKWMNEPEPIDEDIIAGEVHNVWPNPATDLATVSFTVPEAQTVTITLVDALGRPAATVASEYMSAGDQAYEFSVENIPSGLYTVAINGFTFNASVPVMVRK